MSFVVITTERLELVLQTPEETLAFVEAMPPEDRAEISPDWIARVKQTKAGDPWSLGYTVIERESKASVGGCAFKGPPVDGTVEIAYGIDEPHRCKGYATEAANGLTEFALIQDQVHVVRAHSKTDNGPSARVLEKCGFEQRGEVMDPEDGLVCRWERVRPAGR
jgi:[ribosomal protein S5]-alanine N-acetyltransferase